MNETVNDADNTMTITSTGEVAEDLRFHCTTRERPKRKGKQLKKQLAAHGYDLPLTKCHDIMAKMYGFRHLNDLYDHVGFFGASPGDEEVNQAEFDRRFWLQVDRLIDVGVSRTDAEDIIDIVRPTGGARPSHDLTLHPVGNDPRGFGRF